MISLKTPKEVLFDFGNIVKEKRLQLNYTQEELANRSQVNIATLRKFERTGKISLEAFVKIAFVLGEIDNLLNAFQVTQNKYSTMDALLKSKKQHKRQRASGKHV